MGLELLGLAPDSDRVRVVEMWVHPSDLRRPALDPDVTHEPDTQEIFGHRVIYLRPVLEKPDPAFESFFYKQCAEAYVLPTSQQERVPWTMLGYTYAPVRRMRG